ncbi:MAG TPA: pyridoxal 5'-phosphate synthase glutaminase subunit PdxT [Chloroflexota bacterium]|nr:pyridoxal 5'-phosphate synthase glutaminase subunit PdxT [Chloroflexota bacterium]
MVEAKPKIGVLAVQGDFSEHADALRAVGAEPVEVRLPEQLEGLAGLIIPGGESTAISKLLVNWGLLNPLKERISGGFPVWGTCAGAILLSNDVLGKLPDQELLGGMDLTVRRNAFGRQVQSFETDLHVRAFGKHPVRAVFIRAPKIEGVGEGVDVLAELDDGTIAAARQGALLVTTFHPELTPDTRFHSMFVQMTKVARATVEA